VYRNATDAVEYPAEHGELPEVCFRDECRDSDGGPEDVDVKETLVVGDDYELLVVGDVFLALDDELDAGNLEKDFEKGNANLRALVPAFANKSLKEHEGNACDTHGGNDRKVVEYSTKEGHRTISWLFALNV
jgi:hypothetical protein